MSVEEIASTSSPYWGCLDDSQQAESIAEMVARTASDFMTQEFLPGYTFVDEYGLYYSHESGYFYDPSTDFFFHPSTQLYYKFNSDTNSYDIVQKSVSQKWLKKSYQKRADNVFGQEKSIEFGQEDVDILNLLFELGDKCCFFLGETDRKFARKHESRFDYDDLSEYCIPKHKSLQNNQNEFEEGDLSDLDNNSFDNIVDVCFNNFSSRIAEEESANLPPCVRLIQRHIETGQVQLQIVTITGATVGTGVNASIKLIDEKWSENEDVIFFVAYISDQSFSGSFQHQTTNAGFYEVRVDDSTRYSVQINDEDIMPGQKRSVEHGSFLICSGNLFEFHIHRGLNTCSNCELGILLDVLAKQQSLVNEGKPTIKSSRKLRDAERRRQMRLMKEQYGLNENDEDVDSKPGKYVDRAAKRRKEETKIAKINGKTIQVGGIYANCTAAPLSGASTESVKLKQQQEEKPGSFLTSHLDVNNKGASLLKKMGWSSGQGLGKNNQGIQEPIESTVKSDRKGLGSESSKISIKLKPVSAKQEILERTRQRYYESESKNQG